MNNITKYVAATAVLSTLLATAALANTGHAGSMGAITAISGNTVTVDLKDASGLKVGDNVSVLYRAPKPTPSPSANRTISGTVGTVGNGTFTVQRKNKADVTVNTSATTVVTKGGKAATLADVIQGAMVTVKGVLDSATSTITANTVRIFTKVNSGLHRGPRPTPSPAQ